MKPRTLFISNIAWDFVWQRHQTLASLFARDQEVVFCELPGIRKPGWRDASRIVARLTRLAGGTAAGPGSEPPPAGVRVVRPFVLPSSNAAWCAGNARLLDRWLRGEPGLAGGVDTIVNYSPARAALQLIDRVPHRRLLYDCTDDWLAVRGIPRFLAEDERTLLARADLTLVPSRRLEERKRPLARRLERVPHGVWFERFAPEPGAPRRGEGGAVTLLYYGHLHRQHLDFPLLDALARLHPDWRLVLAGPVKTPHAFPPNVWLAGQQAHGDLRTLVAAADVLLLPYVVNDYTRSVMPAKTYECLASGRPVVATRLPELTAGLAEAIRFADDAAGFAAQVKAALAEPPAASLTRIELARANTWEMRYRRIRELLEENRP